MKSTVPLKIINNSCYDQKIPSQSIRETLVNRACFFAIHILWPKELLDTGPVDVCKDFVRNYFQLQGNEKKAFVSFWERMLLAREYYKQYPHLLPIATSWLQADNDEGFAITLPWYHGVLFRRRHIPQFRRDLQRISSTYLTYSQKPTEKNEKSAIHALASIGSDDLHILFEK